MLRIVAKQVSHFASAFVHSRLKAELEEVATGELRWAIAIAKTLDTKARKNFGVVQWLAQARSAQRMVDSLG